MDIGDRMKNNYESISQNRLLRRTPVIIRLDGKAFHTFTKKMKKPFDDHFIISMNETCKKLVENIEGCNFGYTQSDEISLLLTDYKKLETQAWFEYKVQKVVSVASSMCTACFNDWVKIRNNDPHAFFDARAFNIPKEEVVNYFIWRQQDATRNSIQSVGQAHFSHKQLHKKSCNEIQDMLWKEKGINWNDLEVYKKRGTAIFKKILKVIAPEAIEGAIRTEYYIDTEPPIFTQNRDYIQKWVDVEEED